VEQTLAKAENEFPESDVTAEFRTEETANIADDGVSIAIWNLVENAIGHNGREQPEVEIVVTGGSADGHSTTNIEIRDNGPGIPREEKTVINRGDEDALSHGSGIGLWVVK